jgi:hypothetical protein
MAIDDELDEMTRYGSRQLIPYVETLILCFIVRRPDGPLVPKRTVHSCRLVMVKRQTHQ